MASVKEILEWPPHLKEKIALELLDEYTKKKDTVKIFLGEDDRYPLGSKKRMDYLADIMYNFLLSYEFEQNLLTLLVLIFEDFRDNSSKLFYDRIHDGDFIEKNMRIYMILLRVASIDTEEANIALEYLSSILAEAKIFAITERFHARDTLLYRTAAQNSLRNFRTLLSHQNFFNPSNYGIFVIPAIKNPETFRFVMENITTEELIKTLKELGEPILYRVLHSGNYELVKIFLKGITRDNVLNFIKSKYNQYWSLGEDDLELIDKLLLEEEYLSVTELELEQGDDEVGYPLPSLVMKVVGQETDRKQRETGKLPIFEALEVEDQYSYEHEYDDDL